MIPWIVVWVCAMGAPAEQGVDAWNGVSMSEHVLLVSWCAYPTDWPYVTYRLETGYKEGYCLPVHGGCAAPSLRYAWCIDKPTCAHELGHLLGLSHPHDTKCQGYIRPQAAHPLLWDVVDSTVMDWSTGCAGMVGGPYPSDAKLLRAALTAP